MQIDPDQFLRQAQQARKLANRGLTWHNLSQFVAKLTLVAFGSLWLRVYWDLIHPQFFPAGGWSINPSYLWTGALDALLAFALAVACATVPAIFWSGLIPSSPANTLLTRLTAKYGAPGYYFAAVGAVVFSFLGFLVLSDYWHDRAVRATISPVMLNVLLVSSLFLMVGFPAWALNRMTPEQWVDAITQAREVARVQRILELEEMAEKAIIARARALLYVDISTLTAEQRGMNNREIAAILAAAQRGMEQSLQSISSSFESLYGMELITQVEPDDELTSRYRRLAETLGHAATVTRDRASYTELLRDDVESDDTTAIVPVAPYRATVPHQDAQTVERLNDESDRVTAQPGDRHGPAAVRSAAPPVARSDDTTGGALDVARQVFGAEAWMRSHLEKALRVQRTTALEYINVWKLAGVAIKLDQPRDHYQFVQEDAS